MTLKLENTHGISSSIKWLIVIVFLCAIFSSFYSFTSISFISKKSEPVAISRILNINIGAVQLRIPEQYIRDPDQRSNGSRTRVHIAVTWPDFVPLVAPSNLLSAQTPSPIIFMTLEASDDTINPAQRPSALYSRFLTTDVNEGASQLITRIFKAGTPYAGEVLHIAPPNGEVFSARCQIVKVPEARSEHCLWQVRIDKIDVQVRFSEELLRDWEALSANTKQVLESLIVQKQ
jgi:hypothetical protein